MRFRTFLMTACLLAACQETATAARPEPSHPKPSLRVSALELNEDGCPVIQVRLSDARGKARAYRFLLDTGAAMTVLDPVVPEAFFRPTPGIQGKSTDGVGASTRVQVGTIPRVLVAGICRDEVPAIRMDLRRSPLGAYSDRPVDGILGQSFFRFLRFSLDPGRRRVVWQGPLPEGEGIPLRYGDDGLPRVNLSLGPNTFPAILDTGNGSGLFLPRSLAGGKEEAVTGFASGLAGKAKPVWTARLEPRLGPRSLGPQEARLEEEGHEGNVGMDTLGAGNATFDFTIQRLYLEADEAGNWRHATAQGAPRGLGGAFAWRRDAGAPFLEATGLAPGGWMERMGFREGDRILAVEGQAGPAPCLKDLNAALRSAKRRAWTLRRGSERIRLELAAASMP